MSIPRRARERRQRPLGGGTIESHGVGEWIVRIEPTQREAGIGDGRLRPAASVAGGPGLGAGAARAHPERTPLIDRGDTATTRAHGLNQDRRKRERHTSDRVGSFGECDAARDEAGVGAGAAHIERQQVARVHSLTDQARADDAASRTRERQARRVPRCLLRTERSAARGHDTKRIDTLTQCGDLRDVLTHTRSQIRLGRRRAGPFVFPEDRQHFVARGDGNVAEGCAEGCGERPLMCRMPKREQQRNRDGFGGGRQRAHRGDNASDFAPRQRQHRTLRTHALAHTDHVATRNERWRMITRQIVEGRTILASQPQQILKAGGRQESDPGTPPFEERVRRDGRAVHEHIDGLRA